MSVEETVVQTNTETTDENTKSLLGDAGESTKDESTKEVESKDGTGESKDESKDESKVESKDDNQAPEAYEAFTYPEGMQVDDSKLASFTDKAKELNLTQSGAQELIDLYTKELLNTQTAQAQAEADMRTAWQKEISEMPNSQRYVGDAKKALLHYAKDDPEIMELFTGGNSWLGDNPVVIRLLNKIGQDVKEDSLIDGLSHQGKGQAVADVLYPSMSKK